MATNVKAYRATKKQVLPTRSVLKPTKKKEITIALVGATDCGKTPFISLLVDLFLGSEALELTDHHGESDGSELSKGHSQTTKVTLHKVTTLGGAVIQILDTPDFGTEDNSLSVKKTRSAMQADVQSIDAVIVVADGLTPHLATATLNATTDIFPRTLVDNICLVFANSDEGDWKFETDSLPSELQNVRRCLLHNPLATLKVYRKVKKERSDDKQAAEELLDEVKTHYDLAVETLGSWLEWVDSRNTRSTNKLCEPFGLKSKVEKNIKAIPPGLARLEESESELKDIESDLEQAKDEANEIRKKLPPPIMKIPSFPIQPNPPPVSDSRDMERRMTEESLSEKEKEIARLETKRNSSREEVKKAKEAIETIQTDIRHIVDDFQKLYFSQNFTSGVNDAIQMLEHRKKGLESKAETEVERKIIDKIAEMLKEKLRAVGKQ